MKKHHVLTPLAFGLALALSGGAYASGSVGDGAVAVINDSQTSFKNEVKNKGTENTAVIDGSLNSASGNVGANVAAGDNNQQANAAAVSTADALFVFGIPVVSSAVASIDVQQKAFKNDLTNYSVPNNAALIGSANDASGNLGINVAAGNYNQQKNDMAIASSSSAHTATASVNISQKSFMNETDNLATLAYGKQKISLGLNAEGSYAGQSDQIGDVYLDVWEGERHPQGPIIGHIDLDSEAQGAQDLNGDGGALAFNEAGDIMLGGSVSGYIPTVVGFNSPVTNNATLAGSLNRVSGNVGVNIAAGGGNQQSNSLAVTAGCTACP
ncbi:MAG TPA: hypothetical protein VKY38_05165 [Azoarcus sp.]|nr:hypothetical protein [Azoarcus sp.]